jgi:hypothetical protein
MSAPLRPSATAPLEIGIDRNLSVMPFFESAVIALIVASTPNIIARVSMPGTRNEM